MGEAFVFHFVLMPLEKTQINQLSSELWVNSADKII